MLKPIKIALLLLATVLVLLLFIEYSGINSKYKRPQNIQVNPENISMEKAPQ
jgi:hypothetical protein